MKTMIQLMTTTCLVAAMASPAWAQSTQAADATTVSSPDAAPVKVADGDIVVTGSRIRRPNTTSAAPITSVTTAEIQAQAAVNVEEVLNRLPQVAPDSQQNYADSDGRQRIKLRSLGFERTLVLLDGLRLGTQNGQDVGIVPTALLERIDVLSGGASAVYGTDAISGVVNFILKKDFNGVQVNANYSFYNHLNNPSIVTPIAQASGFPTASGMTNDGGRADISIAAGQSFFDGKLNIAAFGDYRTGSLVTYADRSTSSCYLLQTSRDGPLSCQLSTYSPSGFISPRSGANSGTSYVNDPSGTRTFVPYGIGPGNAANPFDGYSYQRQFERYNAGGFVTLKLSKAFEVYGNGIWFRDKSTNPFPARVFSYTVYGGTPYQVNCNNPFLSASQATALCGAAAGTGALVPLEVRYRFNGLPYVKDEYINSGFRATGGIRGDFGHDDAWHYDIGGVYARNQQDTTFGPFPEYDEVNRSLNVVNVGGVPTCAAKVSGLDPACVPFDAFKAGNSDATLANYLFSGRNGTSTIVTQLFDVLATLNGDLGKYGIKSPLANQGLAVAFGLEYRKDRFIAYADEVFRQENGGSDASLQQDVSEANIELLAPLVQDRSWMHLLQLNGGYRVSKYSSNSKAFSTWKVEGLWAPIPDITFRGSFNKAQRAPSVIEAFQASNQSYSSSGPQDPCASVTNADGSVRGPTATLQQCRSTGLPDNLYGSTTLACLDTGCTVRSGGFQLTPETAYTKTFGIILKPRFLPGLTLSIDRYLIDLNQSIGFNFSNFYLDGCLASGDPFYCSGIIRNPTTFTLNSAPSTNPTTGYIRQGTSNFYKATSHGWDIQAQYALALGKAGRLDWSFNGSRPTYIGGQDAPLLLARNCVGFYGPGCGESFPKWQHSLRTTYTTADDVFSLSFNWRYIGPMTVTYNSNDPGIGFGPGDARTTFNSLPATSYFDLALTFAFAKRMNLRISANNLLDKTPPVFPNSYDLSLSRNNTSPARYDSLGRSIAVGVTTRF